ncbi:unnamed protein product [marine sediment metagenome]|uniref:Uncharacterized protein n=1 Tax=marine sediment metagenome TaxID=412755 RepID=X1EKV3_9ZZZZ
MEFAPLMMFANATVATLVWIVQFALAMEFPKLVQLFVVARKTDIVPELTIVLAILDTMEINAKTGIVSDWLIHQLATTFTESALDQMNVNVIMVIMVWNAKFERLH